MSEKQHPHARVAKWRIKKNLTQADVARKLGVSRSSIALIETNRCGITVRLAKKYADLMGCSWTTLITDRD